PLSTVKEDSHLLGDLHLNSITVSQLIAEAARRIGIAPPVAPTDYARVTIAEAARALQELVLTGSSSRPASRQVSGVDSWLRAFTVEMVERPLPRRRA